MRTVARSSAKTFASYAFVIVVLLTTVGCVLQQSSGKVVFEAESEEFEAAAAEYRRIWAEDGARVIEVLEKRTGLPFESDAVLAIVYEGVSFSGYHSIPMRLRASYPTDTKRATLVHELAHRLISDHVDKDCEDHPIIFLFLYDVWVDLWGRGFADSQVAIESERRGIFDYESAWTATLMLSEEERALQWRALVESNKNRCDGSERAGG